LADGTQVVVPVSVGNYSSGEQMKLGIRPEDLSVGDGELQIPFEMDIHERLGPTSYVYGNSGDDNVVAEYRKRGALDAADVATLSVNTSHIHLFGPDGVSVRNAKGGAE